MKRMPTAFHVAPLAGLAVRCQPDARLVTLSREGHERAFEEIVRRYRPPLVRFAAAIVPAHRAEDVVQEALAKAHSSLVATNGEIKLKPWLYTIVRNRALNDLRDEPAHQSLQEDLDGVLQPPEVAVQRSELAGVLARVGRLPPAQREALVRRELEGRSHEEIASAIGVSPGAVRGLIFRARAALRDAAGALIPLPALRALLNGGPAGGEATGVAVGGAAAGLGAGGGGGIAVKAGATLLIAGLAAGSGIALHEHGGKRDATAATVARTGGSVAGGPADPLGEAAEGAGRGRGGDPARGPGPGGESGQGSSASADRSGPSPSSAGSGGERGTDGRGGSGGREDGSAHPGDRGEGSGGDDGHHEGGEVGEEHDGGGTSGEHEGTGGDDEGSDVHGSEGEGDSGDGEGTGEEQISGSHHGSRETSSETEPSTAH